MAREFGTIGPGQDPIDANRNVITRQGLKPHFSPWEGMKASLGNQSIDFLIEGGIVNAASKLPFEKISPEQAQEEYGIETEEPITWLAARYRSKFERERAERDVILNNLDQYATGRTALPLLGSLLDGVTDPANVIAGGAAGIGANLIGRGVGIATRKLLTRGLFVAAELGAEGFIEGAMQNSAMDFHSEALKYTRTDEERRDTLVNAMVYNAIFGGAIKGAQYLGAKWKGKFDKASMDSKYYENAKKPSNVYDQIDYQGRVRPELLETPGPRVRGDGVYYSAHRANSGNYSLKTQHNLGVEIGGEGIILSTDSRLVKNSAVQQPQSTNGQMLSVRVPEVNLVDIDLPANKQIKEAIIAAIGQDRLPNDVVKEALDSGSVRDILETLTRVDDLKNTNYVKKINDSLKDSGIDGYTLKGKDAQGKLTPDESLYLFDPEKGIVEDIEEFNAQQALDGGDFEVSDLMDKEVKYLESKDSHIYSDPETNKLFDDTNPNPLEDGYDLDILQTDIQDLRSEIDFITGEGIIESLDVNRIKKEIGAITEGIGITELSTSAQAQMLTSKIRAMGKTTRGSVAVFTKEQANTLIEEVHKRSDEILSKKRKDFFSEIDNIEDFLNVLKPEELVEIKLPEDLEINPREVAKATDTCLRLL